MVYKLKFLDLHWKSSTSRANVQPVTKEIRPDNFDSGKTWWFDWDANNHRLQFKPEHSEHPPYPASCTTTLLYCTDDGFSSIPYNPLCPSNGDWLHWWSLGFTKGQNGGGYGCYTIARDDEPNYDRKLIEGNGSRWFRLFRGTQHERDVHEARHHEACQPPFLTGVPSLIWALAAFPFDIATLETKLPEIYQRDGGGNLVLPELDNGDQPGKYPGVSTRALVVEIWAEGGHDLRNMELYMS